MLQLRADLLSDRAAVLAGPVADGVRGALAALGARLEVLPDPAPADEDRLEQWASARAPLHALVYDASGAFGGGGPAGLRGAADGAWAAARAVANGALIPSDGGGKIVFIAPSRGARELSGAVAAALENLARTLSVEWARFRLTSTVVVPGPVTSDAELGELVSFLISPAGDYFTGCRFDLANASGGSEPVGQLGITTPRT